jgi:hypothetical protein
MRASASGMCLDEFVVGVVDMLMHWYGKIDFAA